MPDCITANQLVAYNLMRIRKTLGLSQEEAAKRLSPYIGAEWSKTVYSTTERSYHGNRVRQFTADDLLAFSRAFEVPVIYFFLPPRPEDRAVGAGDAKREVSSVCGGATEVDWPELFEVMVGGKMRMAFGQRAFELPREERVNADSFLAAFMGTPRSLEEYADIKSRLDPVFPEEPDVAGRRPIAAAIVVSGDTVLVGERRDGKPPWTFISGEVEPGDSAAETVVREAKEEAGLAIKAVREIGRRNHPATGRHMIYVAAVPTRGTEVFVGDEEELADVRWIGLGEADELMPGMFEPVHAFLTEELGEAGGS